MDIGVPRERKNNEFRVALNPYAVSALVRRGHRVIVESGAGVGSNISDQDYIDSGAEIVDTENELFSSSGLIVKVKEPQPEEFPLLSEGKIVFSYFHLAPDKHLQNVLSNSGVTAVAFETVELDDGSLPLLAPMSRLAGQLSVQAGAHYLETTSGGKGVLLSGAPGIKPGKVVVVGGGTVGFNATLVALGLRAEVVVFDIDQGKLGYFQDRFEGRVRTLYSYPELLAEEVRSADLVVGAVLVTGTAAPKVITRQMVCTMEKGSVLADVAIDQGGCSETSVPTSHDSPTFVDEGVVHYCVTNIPSLVARTATSALSNAIFPYVAKIAEGELETFPPLQKGINVQGGRVVLRALI